MILLMLVLGLGLPDLPNEPLSVQDPQFGQDLQRTLEEEASAFAKAWKEKNAAGLRDCMLGSGIRLRLPDEEHLLIRPRQAQAALEEFLNRFARGETLLSRAALAGDEGQMGFAEIRWETSSPGLSGPVTFTVFLGYALHDGRWTVTEIRVLM